MSRDSLMRGRALTVVVAVWTTALWGTEASAQQMAAAPARTNAAAALATPALASLPATSRPAALAQSTPRLQVAVKDPVCGSQETIACSAHLSALGVDLYGFSDELELILTGGQLALFNDKFYPACATHDYCYRYGNATYGYTRAECDLEFLGNMQELCDSFNIADLASLGLTSALCSEVSVLYYGAVVAAGGDVFDTGPLVCEYEGFCPPGKFGSADDCVCQNGANKVITGVLAESAYCSGTTACPEGLFTTTSNYHGCVCPSGSTKKYSDLASYTAWCEGAAPCPSGLFNTTGKHRGCYCPGDTKKHWSGLFSEDAWCEGLAKCPTGKFSTTGQHRGCDCPAGSTKKYGGLFDEEAWCQGAVTCPRQRFSTTGKWRGCKCPSGESKKYYGLFDEEANCM